MILKPCPYCEKKIPRSLTVCPYCRRDDQGKPVQMDSAESAPVELSGKTLETALMQLASEDVYMREQTVSRLTQQGPAVVEPLLAALKDLKRPGLAGVARVMGGLQDKRAIGPLAQAARLGDETLRVAAIGALCQFRAPEVLPILLAEVGHPHNLLQSFLIHVLSGFHDDRVRPAIQKLLSHPRRDIAFQAAFALGDLGDARAVSALGRAARGRDALVRAAAQMSLKRLGASTGRRGWIWFWAGSATVAILGFVFWWVQR